MILNSLAKRCNGTIFRHFSILSKSHNISIDDELYGLNEEECRFRKTIYEFCQKELSPHAEEIDKNNGWDEQKNFWRKLGNLGLLGVTVPKCYGGLGLSYFQHFLAFEEISRASAAIALSYGVHSNYCVNKISLNANDEQKTRFFPKLLSGEHIGALAMSEAEAGSDVVVSMKLRADKHSDYYILNGSKFWITNGPDTDILIVYARTKHYGLPEHGITCFIVERDMEGFITMPKLDKLGMRGSNTGELVLDNCKVPCKNIIGKVNGGIYVLYNGLSIERALLAAVSLGVMQACIDLAFPYVFTNTNVNQLLQGKVADMYTQLSVCRAYIYSVIRAIDKGDIVSKDSAGCVLYASEKATQIALDAMQCFGNDSYGKYHPAGRFLRDAKLNEIVGGTNEIRRWSIGKRINEDFA